MMTHTGPDAARSLTALRDGRLRSPRLNWHNKHRSSLTPGERAADRLRDWMGSWTFIGAFLAVMAAWIVLNVLIAAWDPYPFILLNLFLSLIAGLQGAILLIAAKRQDAIAAALAQHDFETDVAAKHQLDELLAINAEQLRILRGTARSGSVSSDALPAVTPSEPTW